MKTVAVIYEGAADLPLASLDGRTPLQVARCTHAHELAERGCCGLLSPVREGVDARNEVLLALLAGVLPEEASRLYRGPLEALTLGDTPDDYAYVYRGNLVTLDGDVLTDGLVSSLSEEETGSLAAAIEEALEEEGVSLAVVGPARLAVRVRQVDGHGPSGFPASFMEGEKIDACLPAGKEGEWLRRVTDKARTVLAAHPVNEVRLDLNENPANGLWLWGGGPTSKAGSLSLRRRCPGTLLSQSRMAHGFAMATGMASIRLELPWKEALSEAAFKVAPLVGALGEADHLTVYIEAPEELGWYGSAHDKVRALERMDQYLLGPLLSVLEAYRPYRILLTCDGVVSTENRHPTTGNVPVVLAGSGLEPDQAHRWDEEACALGSLGAMKPEQAMETLLKEAE